MREWRNRDKSEKRQELIKSVFGGETAMIDGLIKEMEDRIDRFCCPQTNPAYGMDDKPD